MNQISINIPDDGKGFNPDEAVQKENDPNQNFRGFGLMSMQERAANIGGHFKIISNIGDGTEIEVLIPRGNAQEKYGLGSRYDKGYVL